MAEYSFGRRGRIAATLPAAAPARDLVGAGGPPVAPPPITQLPSSEPGTMADRIGRLAFAFTILGVLVHAASVAVRALAVDAVPWSNMYEFASVAGLVGVIAFLAVLWKAPQIRHLGGFILLPVILLVFLAGTVLYAQASPLVPALQSYWLAIHVTLVSIAEGALMTSAVLTILFLLKTRYERLADKPGKRLAAFTSVGARLPAATTLDKVAYRIVAFAFPLYTVAIICGAIWAEAAWGRYWGWDPKETWAFIVWVIYACYLHARSTAGWRGSKAAVIAIVGLTSFWFNFIGVNLLVSGLHSYAGV